MGYVQTGVTFGLGAMFGIFTSGIVRRRFSNDPNFRGPPFMRNCPKQARAKDQPQDQPLSKDDVVVGNETIKA